MKRFSPSKRIPLDTSNGTKVPFKPFNGTMVQKTSKKMIGLSRYAATLPGLIALCLLLGSCTGGFQKTTQYSQNREADKGAAFDEASFRAAVGEEKYAALRLRLSDGDFNLLVYGTGQSNAILLVNAVIDITRVTDILNGADAVSAIDLVSLINEVDAHIRANRKYQPIAPNDDTLGKIAQLVNGVNSVVALKKVIGSVAENAGDTNGFNRIQRLALIVAQTNETTNTLATLLNGVVTPGTVFDSINHDKLMKILNGTNDLTRLTDFINGITVTAALTVAELIRTLDDAPGVGVVNTLELLNDGNVKISHVVQIVNALRVDGLALSNSDSFAGTPSLAVPSGIHNWASFSHKTVQNWYYHTDNGFLNFYMGSSQPGGYSVAHTKLKINAGGLLSFTLGIGSLGGGAQVQAAVTGCINQVQTFTTAGNHTVNFTLNAGICHLKIVARESGSFIHITNFSAPGSQGANRSSAQKVAILLNKVNVNGNATLAKILASTVPGGEQAIVDGDIPKLITLIDRAHFPTDISAEPGLVTLINGITNVDTLRRIISGIDDKGPRQLSEIVNFLGDLNKGIAFINQLHSANAGRVYAVINGLTPNATWSLIDTIDNLSVAQMAELKNLVQGVSSVGHFSTILNTLSPVHYTVRQGVSIAFSQTESGGKKLADLLNRIITGGSMTISNEMVRLSDDISLGAGAQNLARIINALDPTLAQPGTQRLYELVDSLKSQGSPRYNHPYDLIDGGSDHTAGGDAASGWDDFGRLTTLANALAGTGADVMATMVNYVDHGHFNKLTELVSDVRRIQYVADLANRLNNLELLIQAIPQVNMTQMLHILNGIGDSTQRGSGSKSVGDLGIFADAMNRLAYYPDGSLRPLSSQLNVVQLINQVDKCGIHPAADENNVWPKYHLAEATGQCYNYQDQTRKRATNVMLGLENAEGLAVLVGDINQLDKVIKLLNGGRSAADLARLVNLIPPQVMLAHLNALSLDHWYYGNAVERSLIYLINRLSPDDIARVVHYGTGIGKGSRWRHCVHWILGVPYNSGGERGYHEDSVPCHPSDSTYYHYKIDRKSTNSGCNYYRGVGPTRMAAFLNLEGGAHMSFLMGKYGARVITAAVGCGTATRSAVILGKDTLLTGTINSSESTGINRGAGNYSHVYAASSLGSCQTNYTGGIAHGTNDWNINTRGYLPEVFASTGFYPIWAVDPHWWGVDLWTPSRVLDNMLYDHLGELYFLMPSPLLPSTAGAGTPSDCDIAPSRDPNTGWTNAVGDGGPGSN